MIIAGFRGTEQEMPAAPLRKPGNGQGFVRRLSTGIAFAAALVGAACSGPGAREIRETLGLARAEPVVYGCANGERFVATYFRLTDDSLRFVKVVFPGGQEHTLPNVVSASGARYTDDREFVWWLKGNTAFVQARDPDGKWLVRSSDCRPVEGQGK